MSEQQTSGAPMSGGEPTLRSEPPESEARETRWVALFFDHPLEEGVWRERQERLTGTRREAEKSALALAGPEQGIVVVPESSWKPKVAEPPREPRIAVFDPWAGS